MNPFNPSDFPHFQECSRSGTSPAHLSADDVSSDRFRDLSPAEQRIASMWRDGEEPIDRQGRPRVLLGNGPASQLVRAVHPMQQPQPAPASHVLSTTDFMRMYEAVATANMQRLVLNTFLTVSWTVGGAHDPASINLFHKQFFASMATWFGDKERAGYLPDLAAIPFAALWVKEEGKRLGLHSHFLLHVPHKLFPNFREWAASAARKLLELPKPEPRQPKPSLRLTHTSWLNDNVDQQWRVFRYLMKGIDEDGLILLYDRHHRYLVQEFAGLKPQEQGRVLGRRVGRSRLLGPAARRNIEAQLGKANIWSPEHQIDGLPYDARYLEHGELRQLLLDAAA